MSGKNNEDRYGVSAYHLSDEARTPCVVAIVADGIGGHRSGEIAAELAVEKVSQFIAASDASEPATILREALIQTGQIIFEEAEKASDYKGMGTTCVCAWVVGSRLYIASLGDSRIYLLRGQEIIQLTVDHTWVQEALDQGALKPEQARGHPNAHVIRRFLGSRQAAVPDLRMRIDAGESGMRSETNQGLMLLPGDILLLCSDGLTDLVDDAELLGAFNIKDLQAALSGLVDRANQRGGHDNITAVALRVPDANRKVSYLPNWFAGWRLWPACLVVSILIGGSVAAVSGLYWYLNRPAADTAPASSTSQVATLFPSSAATQLPALDSPPRTGTSKTPSATSGSPKVTPGPQWAETAAAGQFTLTPWPTNTISPISLFISR
jgi:protein phosphatase